MKAFILAMSSIFFAQSAFSFGDSLVVHSEKLKVLSWNIKMLPGFSGHNSDRSEAIARFLSKGDYDVIVFQEAFDNKSRRRLYQKLGPRYKFSSGPANSGWSIKANSGIWIVSRFPITKSHSIIFKARHGIDALSRKGALLVEISTGQNTFQVIGTHLQNCGQMWLKHVQVTELFHRLLNVHERAEIPQLICGDFNIDKVNDKPNYQILLRTLNAEDYQLDGSVLLSYDADSNDYNSDTHVPGKLIDFIFTRNQGRTQITRQIIVPRQQWNRRHADLSDHFPISAEVQLFPNQADVVFESPTHHSIQIVSSREN